MKNKSLPVSLFAMLFLIPLASGQEKKQNELQGKLDFKMSVLPLDPFEDSNKRGVPGIPSIKAKPGDVIQVVYEGKPLNHFHTYSVDDPSTPPRFTAQGKTFLPLLPVREAGTTKLVYEKELNKSYLEFYTPFQWTQDVLIQPDTAPGTYSLAVQVKMQVCDEKACTYPVFSDAIPIVVEGSPKPLSEELKKRIEFTKNPPIKPPLPLPSTATSPGAKEEAKTLLGFLTSAFVGAFLMLLTPCVFPMIPITVNFFLKQSEKEHHKPLPMAMVYCGTIVLVLSLSVLLLGGVIISLANNAWFNLALGLAMFYFGLSLFGMYEIELPSFLSRFTSSREGKGGMAGTIFMALTFTITSFTCTGPFLGLLLASIAGSQLSKLDLALGALVYSATFAAPFFLLALFPSFLKKLPKSGGWLNTVKVTMGFLELAFALKFLGNTDIALNPGNPLFFNFDTVLIAWIVLAVSCGLYLLGFFYLPHDAPPDHTGVLRMIFGTMMFGLALYMTPILFGLKPKGIIAESIIAFLPPDLKHPGHLIYKDAYDEAIKTNKLIFIDFTGVNCTNCRNNEKNVFTRPEVEALLKKYVILQLYTDTVPISKLSTTAAKDQADLHDEWRRIMLQGNTTNPTYVIFQPDPQTPFDENGVPKGTNLGVRSGQIFASQIPDFVEYLQAPLK